MMVTGDAAQVDIYLDGRLYRIAAGPTTGARIRSLPTPPIGQDRDLYLEEPGLAADVLLQDQAALEVRDSMHFFSAPRMIMAGEACG